MPRAKRRIGPRVATAAVCLLTALAASACGSAVKPATGSRGQIDYPATAKSNRIECLTDKHLPVQKVGLNELLIGPQPAGPRVVFAPTEGAAQGDQISGQPQEQGAEVIGGALLYPNQAPDKELGAIENCLSKGVKG
jgi:hypothetical protein